MIKVSKEEILRPFDFRMTKDSTYDVILSVSEESHALLCLPFKEHIKRGDPSLRSG
jgi:hypothetical protein